MIRLTIKLDSEHGDRQTRPELAITTGPRTSSRRAIIHRRGGRRITLVVEELEQ